jgi:hypothetical protein
MLIDAVDQRVIKVEQEGLISRHGLFLDAQSAADWQHSGSALFHLLAYARQHLLSIEIDDLQLMWLTRVDGHVGDAVIE